MRYKSKYMGKQVDELLTKIGEKADTYGCYPNMSVGSYIGQGEELDGEIRDGSLNDIGSISIPSAPRSYLFVDISHLAGAGKIVVKTTNNNAYSRLWALWKTPITNDVTNRVAYGPLSSESQEAVIDLSLYPDAKYLYVTIGAAGNSASATAQPQTKNIAEKFDEVDEALLYISNIVLPTEIEIAVGDTLNLYYKSIIETNDINNHQVEVLCDVGQSYPRYYTFKPMASHSGKSYTLSVSLKNDRGEQLSTASTNIVVKAMPNTTTTKNILTMGASMVANGNIAYELKRRLTTTSGDGTPANPTGIGLSDISFVGRQKAAYADVQQEATGGWAWRDYVSQGRQAYRFQVSGVNSINMGDVYVGGGLTFTITEINVTDGVGNIRCTYTGSGSIPTSGNLTRNTGNGDATIAYSSYVSETYNPFWKDGKLDIKHYADLYCNGDIDILIAVCGTNDLFTTRPIAEIMEDVKTFARAYHADFPNGKLILSTLPLPSPIGGMGANYNATKDNYYNIALRMFGFAKGIYDMCKDSEFASWVIDCATLQTFDIDNLYPYTERPVNNRMPNVKEKIGTNGVHPTIEGYKTIADALYSTIIGLL